MHIDSFRLISLLKPTAVALLMTTTLIGAIPANAQTLYQVEVIVFASNSGDSEETWPTPQELNLPANTIALLPETAAGTAPMPAGVIPDGAAQAGNADNAIPATAAVATNNPLPPLYSELPLNKKMLNDWRDRLRGSGKYRVLAHTGWLQPANGADAAKPVVITGGTQYGEHFELEGSVRISGNGNPLKVSAGLWLSSFIPGTENTLSTSLLPILPKPVLPAVDNSAAADPSTAATNRENTETDNTGSENSNPVMTTPAAPLYGISRIITHRAQDNLSLNKALYLDHPVLGVVIKVSEFNPQPAALPATTPAAAL